MDSTLKTFRKYTRRCRPVWTLTWRECKSPSIHNGVPQVRGEDTEFNKQLAKEYVETIEISSTIQIVLEHLKNKPDNNLKYKAVASDGFTHVIFTPEWQAMYYFLAVVNSVLR